MISVIISTYEQSDILPLTLASLAAQEFSGHFEVIVADDGSDPATLAAVKKWSQCSTLDVRYVWQPDRGYRLGMSRNNAIRCARGNVLVLLDGDIVVRPDFLSSQCRIREALPECSIVGTFRKWLRIESPASGHLGLTELYSMADNCGYYSEKEWQIKQAASAIPWTACWGFALSLPRRSEVSYDERITGWGGEDYELLCRLHSHYSYGVCVNEELEVIHLITSDAHEYSPWTKADHDTIANYLHNCIYLKAKFQGIDLSSAMWGLHGFVLDESTGRWRRRRDGEEATLAESIARAENWIRGLPEDSRWALPAAA